jgi:hypothetical protein
MKLSKPLPKAVLAKLTAAEQKKLATLQEKSGKLGEEMVAAQWKASEAMNKEDNSGHVGKRSAAVQRLIDKAFKIEFNAFKAGDALRDFKDAMSKKY